MTYRLELIGQHAFITYDTTTFEGTITNETKHTISIQENHAEKRLFKKRCTIKIQSTIILGSDIIMRPEERIKL